MLPLSYLGGNRPSSVGIGRHRSWPHSVHLAWTEAILCATTIAFISKLIAKIIYLAEVLVVAVMAV